MPPVTVVIITKNEAHNIVDCILSAKKISNNIIVVDSGSTDATVLLAQREQVQVVSVPWKGYGYARNAGAGFASNDWIFSLDADERITDALARFILTMDRKDPTLVYGFRRLNHFRQKRFHYGEMAHDKVFRLYHKDHATWNAAPVHELLAGTRMKRQMISSTLLHFGIRTEQYYLQKKRRYAYLAALKYKNEQKRYSSILRFVSPVFHFIKSYIFQLGFLDRRMGFTIAKINARYTHDKYEQLYRMIKEEQRLFDHTGFIHASLRKIASFLS